MAEQDLAMQVLQQVVKLPVVKVDRSKFLVDKFSKELIQKIFLPYWNKVQRLFYLKKY